ncbi:hypothetical protein HMPREF2533_00447 [Bacteroides fragilis]|nr:hypothetical protein HMPREF2530_00447 [Bacteroides fragilis]KXU50243.1 hypothetical protein HMPREF2533_00447 [Bacteroides fragilis]
MNIRAFDRRFQNFLRKCILIFHLPPPVFKDRIDHKFLINR